ncbi:SAM-dependent methyltransferase [Alicyclobacillus dauci]|uniref:SAM-dependent methyltransferase n=1 Tax=Alicyclobacillus dauci TaxID=1475485 RepID=A0ABY6Z649_9BACL|nr:SAM-dependent methyltransferase [Alicyclobacillus dauci]WAH38356.1 SAM-dependent methyltransferase [Alicyclobacillus dauci]
MKREFEEIIIKPIGIVHSPRTEAIDDNWGSVISEIELDANQFDEQVLYGLSDFSHCEVVFFMDRVPVEKIEKAARHPRNRTDWPKVGIFSQRAKGRPNRIGVSRCKILRVDGITVTVQALDAINGTPVIDIKPYMEQFAPLGEVHQPEWSREVMSKYYR